MKSTTPPSPALADVLLGDLPPAGDDAELARLLDAAMDEIAQHGLERTSINHVARRAGVSRPTAYRRLGGKEQLVRRLLVRIAETFLHEFESAVAGVDAVDERAGELFVAGVRTARAHPLVQQLLTHEPDAIVPSLTSDGAPIVAMVRGTIAHVLDPQGTLPAGRAELAADLLVRLSTSFILTASDLVDPEDDDAMRAIGRGTVTTALAIPAGGAGRRKGRS